MKEIQSRLSILQREIEELRQWAKKNEKEFNAQREALKKFLDKTMKP